MTKTVANLRTKEADHVTLAIVRREWQLRQPRDQRAGLPTAAVRLAHMDRLGIARSLVWNVEATQGNPLAANRRLLDEIAHTPGAAGRLIPALVVSGLVAYERNGIERFAAQMEEGRTRALRFVNVGGRLTLGQCAPVVQAVRHLKPFILVKWGETPAQDILEFAALFPDVPVVLTDLIWVCGIGAFDAMRQRPNVLMETSWWHTWEGVALAVKHFGAERVLFGTGYRSHNSAAIAALVRAEISKEQRELIAHGNLDRLTGSASDGSARPRGPPGIACGSAAWRASRWAWISWMPTAIWGLRRVTCWSTRTSASRFPPCCA